MEIGTRVTLSDEGRKTFPLSKRREGTIVGLSNTPGCRRVLWGDGPKQAETTHMDFLTPVPSTPNE